MFLSPKLSGLPSLLLDFTADLKLSTIKAAIAFYPVQTSPLSFSKSHPSIHWPPCLHVHPPSGLGLPLAFTGSQSLGDYWGPLQCIHQGHGPLTLPASGGPQLAQESLVSLFPPPQLVLLTFTPLLRPPGSSSHLLCGGLTLLVCCQV